MSKRTFEITHRQAPYTIRVSDWDSEGDATVEVWAGHQMARDDFHADADHDGGYLGSATWDGVALSSLTEIEGLYDAPEFWGAVRSRLPR